MKNKISCAISGFLTICIYGYLVAVLAVLAILWISGDRWWFGTVLLYGPRWIYALPLAVFLPLAILWRRRWLWPLGMTAVVIAWPIMGLSLPSNLWSDRSQPELRVLTYNVHRWDVRGADFSRLFEETKTDIAAVQECASTRRFKKDLPSDWFTESAGYSIVISRYPITNCEVSYRGHEVNGLYCVIETPSGPIGFGNADLLTPRRALKTILDRETVFDLSQIDYAQQRIAQRWRESESLFEWLQRFPEADKIIAGDFNLTPDSPIYRTFWTGYQNAYSRTAFGYGHTKRTKINIFNYKSRIDHILSTPDLKPVRSWVGPDLGSDHYPLLADFARN